eukprot:scaffold10253_cov124-Isochrysis_galbana.AAC.3
MPNGLSQRVGARKRPLDIRAKQPHDAAFECAVQSPHGGHLAGGEEGEAWRRKSIHTFPSAWGFILITMHYVPWC